MTIPVSVEAPETSISCWKVAGFSKVDTPVTLRLLAVRIPVTLPNSDSKLVNAMLPFTYKLLPTYRSFWKVPTPTKVEGPCTSA